MNHRVIHAVPAAQAHGLKITSLPSVKSPGNKVDEDKDKNKNKYDFLEIVKQSNLELLS
jgi:hypothetical protein